MKFKKEIIFLCLVFCVLLCISAVSASDMNDTKMAASDVDDQISAVSKDIEVQSTANQEKLQASSKDDDKLQMMGTDASSGKKVKATIYPKKLTTSYYSGNKFQVKVVDSKKQPVSNAKLLLRIYTGNKYSQKIIKTQCDGFAYLDASKLKAGTHKIAIASASKNVKAQSKLSVVKITKAKLAIKAPKVTNGYKTSGKFKVAVKNRATNHGIAKVTVILKIYTGKKYKVVTAKTNKKGVAAINTKKLKLGNHKVVVKVKGSKNFKAKSAVSAIKITKQKQTHISVADADTWFTANYYGSILFIAGHVALVDNNGNVIKGKDMTFICRSGSFSGPILDKGTFTSAEDGDSYTRNMGASPNSGVPLYFTFIFKGDSKYMKSSVNYEFYRQMYY